MNLPGDRCPGPHGVGAGHAASDQRAAVHKGTEHSARRCCLKWFVESRGRQDRASDTATLKGYFYINLVETLPRPLLFQPTTQPTKDDVLYDLRVFWQSPRCCKLL